MTKAMFVLNQTREGNYTYSFRASNGEVLFTSPVCPSRLLALQAIDTVRLVCARDINYDRLLSAQGEAYFVLRDANRAILGTSRMQTTVALREVDIATSKLYAPLASVVEG